MPRVLRLALIVILFALSSCQGSVDLGQNASNTASDTPDTGKADSIATTAVCGDGLIAGPETCDGTCPTACDDGNSCTSDSLSGAAESCDAVCSNVDITMCIVGDGCCPDGCDSSNDADCSDSCGDGVQDDGETCDGNCPTACDDGNACTASRLTGSADRCNVQCSTTPITACVDGDGCCAPGCLATTDSDCGAVCGNGVVEGIEVCDGDCPVDCDDQMVCTTDVLRGSAATCDAVCTNTVITQCVGGDGCCPATCHELNDSDCQPECGNDVVETGETCDGACPDCNDGVACTADSMSGTAATCDVVCMNTAITACVDGDGCCAPGCDSTNDMDCNAICGNGVLEGGEVCDPIADCPTTCDDGDACTANNLVGDAQTCDAVCLHPAITMCTDADGCCPNGCNANNDDDCMAMCGNAITEPGESCDPMSSCPPDIAACDDTNACTGDVYSGDAAQCTAMCSYNDVTACIGGDGCCPTNCDISNDTDCASICGNGVVETGETCDPIADCPTDCDDQDYCTTDTLTGAAASCTSECQNSPITMCIDGDMCCPTGCDETNDDDCSALCGNGVLESGETCDPQADCPTSCDDADDCTSDALLGSASTCTAECEFTDITMCIDSDGCCPTGCNATNDDDCACDYTPVPAQDPEPGFRAGITAEHNYWRWRVGTAPLQWNATLAASATAYAETCVWAHDPNRSPDAGFNYVGENLYLSSSQPSNALMLGAVISWAAERADYDFGDVIVNGGPVVGHYTQVTWDDTTDVGCGYAYCPSVQGAFPGTIVACRYGPGGNYLGQTPYDFVTAACVDLDNDDVFQNADADDTNRAVQ